MGLLVCCASVLGAGEVQGRSTVESFKCFLSLQPAISNVVFERQVLLFPHLPNGVRPDTNQVQYYQAGRQSNGFYIRRVWSLADVDSAIYRTSSTAGLLFAGKAADRSWHIVNTNIYATSEPGNYVAQMSINAEAILSSALGLGLEDLVCGSLVWDGDTFTARSTRGGQVRGSLEVSGDVPRHLTVQHDGLSNSFVAEYVYSNENPLPYGVPNQVHMALANGQAIVPQVNTRILSAYTVNETLPLAFFQPERFIEADKQEIVFTNGALYLTSNGSVQAKIVSASMASAGALRHKDASLVFYIISLTVTLSFAVLVFSRSKKSMHGEN